MLNKLEFNNQILINKDKIQQVKVHIIQKLVQKIRKLKYLLQKNPGHSKNKEKMTKTMMCLEELKKLKRVDLMKNVLVLERSPSAILTNGLSTPEEMVIAMAASHRVMQELMKHIREKLSIAHGDNTWKSELLRTSKRRTKISRTERKRKDRLVLKEQKAIARKRVEWLKGQTVAEISACDRNVEIECRQIGKEGANVSTLGYWTIEPIDVELKQTKPIINSEKLIEKGEIKELMPKGNTTGKELRSANADVVQPLINIPKEKHATDEEAKVVVQNSMDSSKGAFENENGVVKIESRNTPYSRKENVTHVIDSFFITNSGENYHSTAVVVRDGQVVEPQMNKNSGEKKGNIVNNCIKPFKQRTHNHLVSMKNRHTIAIDNVENLHPSWAAKQRLKPIIIQFQGKKIKFEEGDNSNNTLSKNCIANCEVNEHKMATTANSLQASEVVYPSWKQKIKPVISSSQKPQLDTVTAIHPSWLAKQKQKPTITAFQGKKIIFDIDD